MERFGKKTIREDCIECECFFLLSSDDRSCQIIVNGI